MSKDRSVATDALETLGNIIDESAGGRDAIHLAVERVTAAENIVPGQDIGLIETSPVFLASGKAEEKLGIADPFVKGVIPKGSQFWLVVYPREITSLRHVWSHPAFPDESEVDDPRLTRIEISRAWIEEWASSIDSDYVEVMRHAVAFIKTGEYWIEGGRFEGEYVPEEFWKHYNIIMNRDENCNEGSFFSCSC